MQFLYQKACSWNGYVFIAAIKNGNFDNIKWLNALNCPYKIDPNEIAENIWMQMNGFPWNVDLFAETIATNNFNVFLWLIYKKYKPTIHTFSAAILSGDITTLRCLITLKCPFESSLLMPLFLFGTR